MCGICAGYREKVALGGVIVADLLWTYDEGKIVAGPCAAFACQASAEVLRDFLSDKEPRRAKEAGGRLKDAAASWTCTGGSSSRARFTLREVVKCSEGVSRPDAATSAPCSGSGRGPPVEEQQQRDSAVEALL
jgi:hypothetical protein